MQWIWNKIIVYTTYIIRKSLYTLYKSRDNYKIKNSAKYAYINSMIICWSSTLKVKDLHKIKKYQTIERLWCI